MDKEPEPKITALPRKEDKAIQKEFERRVKKQRADPNADTASGR